MTTNTIYTTLAQGANGTSSADYITVTGDSTVNLTGAATMPWNGTYTINDNWSITDTANSTTKVRIHGQGIELDEEADIVIKGKKLSEVLAGIETRLGLLTANPKLESEFEELRALGERYRELERQLNQQLQTWDILKRE
jgi:hypothetical protein